MHKKTYVESSYHGLKLANLNSAHNNFIIAVVIDSSYPTVTVFYCTEKSGKIGIFNGSILYVGIKILPSSYIVINFKM